MYLTSYWEQTAITKRIHNLEDAISLDKLGIYYRIVTYNNSTLPIIKLYESRGLVKRILANRGIDEVNNIITIKKNCFIVILTA